VEAAKNGSKGKRCATKPSFRDLITPLLGEHAIMDPSHVMALLKLPGEVLGQAVEPGEAGVPGGH